MSARVVPPRNARAGCLLAALLLSACEGSGPAERPPVLEFPETGIDDPEAYEGYATRFFRDAAGNAIQVYLRRSDGRVVHVWADAANESAAFSARARGGPAPLDWASEGAWTGSDGPRRWLRHRLVIDAGEVELGWFLLGTMRQERDFQYAAWQRRPFGDPPFVLPELEALIAAVRRLPPDERATHLSHLDAADVGELDARLRPGLVLAEEGLEGWLLRVEQPSLDGRSLLSLELRGGLASEATLASDRVVVRARDEGPIELEVTVTTDAEPLTPLGRERLLNADFERYYDERERAADSLASALDAGEAAGDPRLLAFRRLERQVLGLELLSSEEKLMASLPNYATYFGRDQMMSALMLEPVSSADLQELVIASVLRKIDPAGNVSHEEALGGQAIREAAAEYAGLVAAWEEARETDPVAAEASLTRARQILAGLQTVRENYRMVDDDFQLLVLVDRYLARDDVPPERARSFFGAAGGPASSRFEALVRNMAFAARLARPYAERPVPANLVAFFHEDDEGPLPGSWRDSRAGYGNGRWGMDVNVVWVPAALEALERVVPALEALGFSAPTALEGLEDGAALRTWLEDPAALRAAVETWRGARGHFRVRLEPAAIRRGVEVLLAELPEEEAAFWRARLEGTDAADRPLPFLALALAGDGSPVRAPNTDPATDLFLGAYTEEILAGETETAAALELIDAIARPYPVGLFVEGLGPLIVNAAYADERARRRFREDPYHSPRVVWGREVNLLLLGLARRIEAAYDAAGGLRAGRPEARDYVAELHRLLERTRAAVEASGLAHNELWSYRIEAGALQPVRYGQSSDIQLWNLTDLAVGFALDRLPSPEPQE